MEEALIAYLLAASAITALVDQRITSIVRDQGAALPAIVLTIVDSIPVYADEGEMGLTQARLQVDCWAMTTTTASGALLAKQVARAVKALLSGAKFTTGGVEFQAVWTELEQDLFEQGTGAEPDLYRVSLDFQIAYS